MDRRTAPGRHLPGSARADATLIAAVADGVSGAAQSHLGAALAVRQAVVVVLRQLDRGEGLDWHEIFKHAAWALIDAHRAASGDPHAGLDDAASDARDDPPRGCRQRPGRAVRCNEDLLPRSDGSARRRAPRAVIRASRSRSSPASEIRPR